MGMLGTGLLVWRDDDKDTQAVDPTHYARIEVVLGRTDTRPFIRLHTPEGRIEAVSIMNEPEAERVVAWLNDFGSVYVGGMN